MAKKIGILTAGSDAPGLNATIRGFGKALQGYYGMGLIGFRDGFQGLLQNKVVDLGGNALSNILTAGGTVLCLTLLRKMATLWIRPTWR